MYLLRGLVRKSCALMLPVFSDDDGEGVSDPGIQKEGSWGEELRGERVDEAEHEKTPYENHETTGEFHIHKRSFSGSGGCQVIKISSGAGSDMSSLKACWLSMSAQWGER